MDLTCMTVPDVADLIDRLALVKEAAVLLDRGGLSPLIDVTDDGVTLTASWDWAGGDPAVIEPAAEAMIGPWELSVEEATAAAVGYSSAALAAALDAGAAESTPWPVVVDDYSCEIDRHLLTITRRGDWHMGADLALLVVLLDNPVLNDRGIAELVGRDEFAVAERISLLTDGARFPVMALAMRLKALMDRAADDEQVAALEAAVDAGAAEQPQPGLAGGQDAEAPPPAEEAARGAFPGGGQDLPASQPGMTGLSARGEGSTAQSPEPAPAAGESGGAAAEDHDLPGSSPPAEPPAAATGTAAAAVEAPPLAGQHPLAGERVGSNLVTGALTDAEKAEIRRRHAAGESSRDIARALNRRTQLVGAWISGLAHQEKLAALKAATGAAKADPAPAPVAKPAAPAAPVQAVRPGVPDHVIGEHRRIWAFLDRLDRKPPFDAETDLAVYDAYDSGAGVQALALDLGMDGAALVRRYKDIVGCILDAKGRPRPKLKMKMAAVLRWRAEAAAKAAAKSAAA